jgi:ankyrin repeat protein
MGGATGRKRPATGTALSASFRAETVPTLLEARADVHVAEALGDSALLRCFAFGRETKAELLLASGVAVNQVNHDEYSALVLATLSGSVELTALLLRTERTLSLLRTPSIPSILRKALPTCPCSISSTSTA